MDRLIQISTLALCKIYMNLFNSNKIYNIHILKKALFERPPGVPLITFSNHTSVLDDPLVVSLLTPSIFSNNFRYALGAEEVILGGSFIHRWLFTKAGRVIPIRRGEGPFQPAMDTAVQILNKGNWLHIFVEGKVNPDSSNLHTPIRHGIARFILECNPKPLLLPIIHRGMEQVKPYGTYIPRLFKHVDVHVGDIIDGGALFNRLPHYAEPVLYHGITLFLQKKLIATYPKSPLDIQ